MQEQTKHRDERTHEKVTEAIKKNLRRGAYATEADMEAKM